MNMPAVAECPACGTTLHRADTPDPADKQARLQWVWKRIDEVKKELNSLYSEEAALCGLNMDQINRETMTIMRTEGFIQAVKFYREKRGTGLKESHDAVMNLRKSNGL